MPNICLLTDSLIQYPAIRFPGQNRIRSIQITPSLFGKNIEDNNDIKISELPETVDDTVRPHLITPSEEEIRKILSSLLETFDEIVAIFSSASLSSTFETTTRAITKVDRQSRIQVIDSQTISLGLGYLVKYSADQLEKGDNSKQLIQKIYAKIPHIYTLFNIPSLSYLYHNGLLDRSQAYVGEKLELMPNFSIEDGCFISTDKMRNKRHITDYFLEFIKEFESIEYIAFAYGYSSYSATAKLIRDFVKETYNNTEFSEHKISLPVATLFGPSCQGLMIVDSEP